MLGTWLSCMKLKLETKGFVKDIEIDKDDAALPQAFSNKSFQELFAETYDHRISQAEWVRDMDYKKQGDAAQIVCEKLNTLR